MRRNIEALTRREMAAPMNSNVICALADRLSQATRYRRTYFNTYFPEEYPSRERGRFILEETRRDEFLIGKANSSLSNVSSSNDVPPYLKRFTRFY